MGPPRKNGLTSVFRPTQKMGPDGPKWGQEDFFLTNPDLAGILGDTDSDFDNSYFQVTVLVLVTPLPIPKLTLTF